jgi:hypothetical protein
MGNVQKSALHYIRGDYTVDQTQYHKDDHIDVNQSTGQVHPTTPPFLVIL